MEEERETRTICGVDGGRKTRERWFRWRRKKERLMNGGANGGERKPRVGWCKWKEELRRETRENLRRCRY